MKKKLNIAGFAVLLLITLQIFAGNRSAETDITQQTDKPGAFLSEWSGNNSSLKDTLILLDLDDTCISTPSNRWLGSSIMFSHLRDQVALKYPDKTVKEAVNYIYPLIAEINLRTPVVLTDDQLPLVVRKLIKQGVAVLGFTARAEKLMSVTLHQLKRVNLYFNRQIGSSVIQLENKNSIYAKKGVVFIGVDNKKGDAAVALLASGKLPYKPSKVLLIDDMQKNLDSTQEALEAHNPDITFIPVRSTYPEKHHQSYQDKPAKEELLKFLYQHRRERHISKLIRKDAFTSDIIAEQCKDPSPDNVRACKILRAF